jgi:uncharacterized protein
MRSLPSGAIWLNPRFLRMLRDILHFNAKAEWVATDPDMTIGGLLERLGTGPGSATITSAPFVGRDLVDADAGIWISRRRRWSGSFRNHALLG